MTADSMDPAAAHLEAFYRRAHSDLVGLAVLLTGNFADAQDVVQDVFAKLASTNLDLIDNLDAYTRKAITNSCASRGRGRGRDNARRRHLQDEFRTRISTHPDPYLRVEILDALSVLPRRQRAAVVLRYYEGLSDADIGQFLGCADGTVRSLLSRAVNKLRDKIDGN